jgi:ABC-2 type transport system permease protein
MTTNATDRSEGNQGSLWRVIAAQELRDLWFSAKGLAVLFGYSVLLGATSYLVASDASLNLLDARESVSIVVRVTIAFGALAALAVSADAISGERERGTLEALLLTPISRRDIILGKLFAATTMWIAAAFISLPYLFLLSRGPGIVIDALLVTLVAGSLVAATLTALGLAISSVSHSNRVSLAGSFAVMLLLAAPSQLPTVTANGVLGSILVKANPVSAGLKLANSVLVDQESWSSQWEFLVSPTVGAVILTALAIMLSRRLELGGAR